MNLKPYIHIAKYLDRCYFYRLQYAYLSSYAWCLKVYMTADNYKVFDAKKRLFSSMCEAYNSNEITPIGL